MTNNYSFHYVSIHLDTMFHTHIHIHMHRHVYTHALLYSIELFLLVKGRAPEIRARSFISLLFFPPSLYTLRPHFFELPLFATSFLLSPLLHRVPPDYRGSTWLLMTTWDHRREMEASTHTLSDPSTSSPPWKEIRRPLRRRTPPVHRGWSIIEATMKTGRCIYKYIQ